MIKKKLIKNIAKNGVINGANANYTFTFPLINQDNTISIDLTNYYNKSEVDSIVADLQNQLTNNLDRVIDIETYKENNITKIDVSKIDDEQHNSAETLLNIYDTTLTPDNVSENGTSVYSADFLNNINFIHISKSSFQWSIHLFKGIAHQSFEGAVDYHTIYFYNKYTNLNATNVLYSANYINSIQENLQSQITNINGSLVGQDEFNTLQTQVNTNTTNITTNANNLTNTNNKLDRVISELQNSTLINYNGEWVDGTSAKLGQVYSYNGAMYLCKVENTTNTPTNTNDWDLISSTDVNLSNYYNRSQIDNMLSDINTNITNLQTTLNNDIQELGNELNSLSQSVDNLGSTYLSKEAFIREYTDNTNRNAIQVGWDIDVPPPSGPDVSTPVKDFYRLMVKQKYNDDYVADDRLFALWNKKTNNPDLDMEIYYGTYNCPYIDNLETNLQNQINELKSNGGVSGALNITTDEQIVPNFTIMGKPVYCKYIDENLTTNQNKVILENVELLVWNGVNILSSKNQHRYNQTGGKSRYTSTVDAYAGVYVSDNKIYVSKNNLNENFSFKGIIYYTKI